MWFVIKNSTVSAGLKYAIDIQSIMAETGTKSRDSRFMIIVIFTAMILKN
jgi:hypothetical protein